MCLTLYACSKGETVTASAAPTKAARTDVVYGLTSDIASLDPIFTTDQITTILYRQMYDTLVAKDADGKIVPKLAESWTISSDNLTYTFKLRKDVICHDGSKMTSKDVVYSINRTVKSAAKGASMVSMKDCTAVDDYTVEVHLTAPYAPTLEVLFSNANISSANTTNYDTAPIGTGPYMFISRSSGDNIKLKAFDKYYLGAAKIKDLTFKVITDTTTQIAALQKGEIDFLTHCPLTAKSTVEGDKKLVWNQTVFRGNIWVSFCQNKAPFDNVLARKAVQYCVDKNAILLGGSEGLGKTMNTIFPAAVGASPEADYKPTYSYDVKNC